MKGLARAYQAVVVVAGATLLGVALARELGLAGLERHSWWASWAASSLAEPSFWVLVGLALVAEWVQIPLPRGGRMSAGFVIGFATLLILGQVACIAQVALVSFVSTLFAFPGLGKRWAWQGFGLGFATHGWRMGSFNAAQQVLAYGAAHAALTWNHLYIYGFPSRDDTPYVALALVAYLATSFTLVDLYLGLRRGVAPWAIFWEDDLTELTVTLALAPMALLMTYMHQWQGWYGASLALVPIFATAYGVRLYMQVRLSEHALAEINGQLRLLQEVAARITSNIDLDTTLQLIAAEVGQLLQAKDCAIFLRDEAGEALLRQPARAEGGLSVPLAHGLLGEVARTRSVAKRDDLAAEGLDVGFLAGHRSLLAVPILHEDQPLGVLAVFHSDPGAFDPQAERLLLVLASQAAAAIRNAQLYRATQQLAITDGLTKLYNRRYFEEKLAAELERASRLGLTTSLVLLDVDHFKKFNDTHGHLLGDQVLQGVARVLQKSTRETDLVARYGGEEFAVILPETPPEAAMEVAERIRRNIKAHPFWGRGQTPLVVTASVGLSCDPSSSVEPRALIDASDACLYQAKGQGRDRVCRSILVEGAPTEVVESRVEQAPEASVRRPTRSVAKLKPEEWNRYLEANGLQVVEAWWQDERISSVLSLAGPEAHAFWVEALRHYGQLLLSRLLSDLGQESQEVLPLEEPLAQRIEGMVGSLVAAGASPVQLEQALLGLYRRLQSLIQAAPFPLEERLAISGAHEGLFQSLSLVSTQVWHRFFSQSSEHLLQVAQLEARWGEWRHLSQAEAEVVGLLGQVLGAEQAVAWAPATGPGHWRPMQVLGPGPGGLDGLQWAPPPALLPCIEGGQALLVQPEAWQTLPPGLVPSGARGALALSLGPASPQARWMLLWPSAAPSWGALDLQLAQKLGHRLGLCLARVAREEERQHAYVQAVDALAEALAQGQGEERNRLEALLQGLAQRLGLDGHEQQVLLQAARLHDLGELAVPPGLLGKAGPLEASERAKVQDHPLVGAKLLGYAEALKEVVPVVRHHHERSDGTGYPDGLKGEAIPLLARVLSLADAYQAMTSDRPYRPAMTAQEALAELRRQGHHDPQLVEHLAQWVGTNPRS